MTDLKAIRELIEQLRHERYWHLRPAEMGRLCDQAADTLSALLDLIEKPDEKAVERAYVTFRAHADVPMTLADRLKVALRAAFAED